MACLRIVVSLLFSLWTLAPVVARRSHVTPSEDGTAATTRRHANLGRTSFASTRRCPRPLQSDLSRVSRTSETPKFVDASKLQSRDGPIYELGADIRLTPRFALGASGSFLERRSSGDASASIPHPFFFNRPRPVSGTFTDVDGQTVAIHLQARWFRPIGRRLDLSLSGGPSVFQAQQEFVADVADGSDYPYDTATLTRDHHDAHSTRRWLQRRRGPHLEADEAPRCGRNDPLCRREHLLHRRRAVDRSQGRRSASRRRPAPHLLGRAA